MSSVNFPDPQTHEFPEWVLFDDYFYYARDIVCFGAELSVKNLRNAYRAGIFPWHIEGLPLPWYCPEKRAILEFDELHVPRSLEKARRKNEYSYTIDKDFRGVIEACSNAQRTGEAGTWITAEFIEAYCKLNEAGMAHSVEARDEAGELVGGLYGVDAGGVFCGESMFHRASNASKLALLHLVEYLKLRGSTWLDVQVMTPHFKSFGAKEISRKAFLKKLKETQGLNIKLFDAEPISKASGR